MDTIVCYIPCSFPQYSTRVDFHSFGSNQHRDITWLYLNLQVPCFAKMHLLKTRVGVRIGKRIVGDACVSISLNSQRMQFRYIWNSCYFRNVSFLFIFEIDLFDMSFIKLLFTQFSLVDSTKYCFSTEEFQKQFWLPHASLK